MVSDGPAPDAIASSPEGEVQPAGHALNADAVAVDVASAGDAGDSTNGLTPTEETPIDAAPTEAAPIETALADGGAADDGADDATTDGVRTPRPVFSVAMVFDLAVDLPAPHATVTLREVDGRHRLLVIPIGMAEATALAHAWRGVPTPRPLTHELFADVLTRLGATIDAVRLTGRMGGIVLAEIEISSPRGREVVPCRPTDAVTLAVRQGVPAPILVDRRLFKVEGDAEPRGAVTF
jgi:bifunctional DNase/RNase